MHPDMCQTTSDNKPTSDYGAADREKWDLVERQARFELTAAQQRFDAVRALRRVWEAHGHAPALMHAAETVADQYPDILGQGNEGQT